MNDAQIARKLQSTAASLSALATVVMSLAKMLERPDDAQLANVDLQNQLQKQQQTLQMLSNVSKTLNDTTLAIIRKIGG